MSLKRKNCRGLGFLRQSLVSTPSPTSTRPAIANGCQTTMYTAVNTQTVNQAHPLLPTLILLSPKVVKQPYYYYYWSLLYSAILCSRADSLRSHVILHAWIAFYSTFFLISTEVAYLQRWHGWCHKKLLPSRRVLCTPYNHAPCHFMQSHIRKVYACLANLPPALLAEWPGSFTCYCGNTGVERIPK